MRLKKQIRSMIKLMVEDGVIDSLPHGFMVTPDEYEYIKIKKKDIRNGIKLTVKKSKIYVGE